MLVAGSAITIGTAVVFVPQDLAFLGLDRVALDAIDPRLVPLIAHDRAGFGAGLATTGVTVLASVFCGRPSRALWEALALAGLAGFAPVTAVPARLERQAAGAHRRPTQREAGAEDRRGEDGRTWTAST
jgi:hypothetical protein